MMTTQFNVKEKHVIKVLVSFGIFCALLTKASAQTPSPSDIQEGFLSLKDGTRIHLLEAGRSSSAPALVFIPGWTLPAFLWTEQIQRFSSDRLVIAIDPRSQGDSSVTEQGNTPEQRARDIREILSTRQIRRAVLIGWSQGANDVAAYVQQFGTDSIAGLVFVDSRRGLFGFRFCSHPALSATPFSFLLGFAIIPVFSSAAFPVFRHRVASSTA